MIINGSPYSTGWPSSTRIARDRAGARRRDLVHRLHRLDDQQRLAFAHLVADVDIGLAARLGRTIGGADHRRGDAFRDAWRARRGALRLRGIAALARSGAGAGCGRVHRWTARRRATTRMRVIAALDLDLGQPGLGEEVGELADEIRSTIGLLLSSSSSRFFLRLAGHERAARASSAST